MSLLKRIHFWLFKNIYLLLGNSSYKHFLKNLPRYKERQIELLKKIHQLAPETQEEEALRVHRQKETIQYDQLPKEYFAAKKNTAHPLTGELIKVIEPTSGSSGRKKRILYTAKMLNIFQKMFLLWSVDILNQYKNLKTGLTYISISPRFSKDEDEGMQSDKDYLNSLSSLIISPFLLCPTRVSKIKNSDDFFLVTTLYFVCAKDLEIVSVWSPSFLGSMIKCLSQNHQKIKDVLEQGFFITNCQQKFKFTLDEDQRWQDFENKRYHQLFNNIKLISCWVVPSGKTDIAFLKEYFRNAAFQPKGLLATESPLTIPLFKESYQIPLYDEVFFEFENSKGEIKYLWQLEIGEMYEVIFSHRGGLVRYRLNDLIKVGHLYQGIPTLEFQCRSGAVSDLVGEKLTELFLSEVASSLQTHFDWIMMTQKEMTYEKCYFLFYEKSASVIDVEVLKKKIEQSYHFEHALILKQLQPTKLIPIEDLKNKVALYYEKKGIKRGDQKSQYLIYKDQDRDLADFLKTG